MGWLGKLFGAGTVSIDSLRKAVQQKRFAEARLLAEQLTEQGVAADERIELAELQTVAGDELAKLNLDEAVAFQRAGDGERGREHLELALETVCSTELRNEIAQHLSAADSLVSVASAKIPTAVTAGCDDCGAQASVPLAATDAVFPDPETQLELVLTAYSEELAEHYRKKGEIFLQAFLLSHAGDDAAALPLWQQVPAAEQDALYYFEYGAALARVGRSAEAREPLEKALQLAPGLLLASEALVPVLISLGETAAAQQHLQDLLEKGQDPGFCHAQLAMVLLQQQQTDKALEHVRQALSFGVVDPEFWQLAAILLEQAGHLEEAETVLQRLPGGGGCGGGGVSLPLAEFLLRQKRELEKVLDTFNAACRQEPDNPRWQLRVAQTYLARSWHKEGLELLQKVSGDPRLEPGLQQEVEALLAAQQG